MSTELKFRMLLAFALTCLVAIAIQGYALWRVQTQLTALGQDQDPAATLEERILSQLDQSRRPPTGQDPFAAFPPDPFTSIQQLQSRIDSLFGTVGPGDWSGRPGFALGAPDIELTKTAVAYEVLVRVPMDKTLEVNTSIDANALSIEGTIATEANRAQNNFGASVFSQSRFSRTIRLPEPVDALGLTNRTTEDGILITIPKKTA